MVRGGQRWSCHAEVKYLLQLSDWLSPVPVYKQAWPMCTNSQICSILEHQAVFFCQAWNTQVHIGRRYLKPTDKPFIYQIFNTSTRNSKSKYCDRSNNLSQLLLIFVFKSKSVDGCVARSRNTLPTLRWLKIWRWFVLYYISFFLNLYIDLHDGRAVETAQVLSRLSLGGVKRKKDFCVRLSRANYFLTTRPSPR